MFSKQFRIAAKEFNSLIKGGVRMHSPSLMLQFVSGDLYKFAVVVPKKVFKKAVDRNKVKRVLYGYLKKAYTEELLATGMYILVLKKPANQKTLQEIKNEVQGLLDRV